MSEDNQTDTASLSPVIEPKTNKPVLGVLAVIVLAALGVVSLGVFSDSGDDPLDDEFTGLMSEESEGMGLSPDFEALTLTDTAGEAVNQTTSDSANDASDMPSAPLMYTTDAPVRAPPDVLAAFEQPLPRRATEAKLGIEERERRVNARRSSGLVYNQLNRLNTGSTSDNRISDIRKQASDRIEQLTLQMQSALNQTTQSSALTVASDEGVFSASSTPDAPLRAQWIKHPNSTLLQGDIIPAILDSQLDSSLSGLVRAIVSDNIYSESGHELLIQRGSKLVGEYQQANDQERRVFVVWTRLIEPRGYSIKLAAPATDALGATGLSGEVDSRFFQRFGASTLLSIIGGFAQNQADDNTESAQLGADFNSAASVALQNSVNLPPIVRINRGTSIAVYINQDLDFTDIIQSDSFKAVN